MVGCQLATIPVYWTVWSNLVFLFFPGSEQDYHDITTVVVSLLGGVLGAICLTMMAFIICHAHKSNISSTKTNLYPQK